MKWNAQGDKTTSCLKLVRIMLANIVYSCGLFLQIPVDLVTFTEEILNAKLHFLCSHKFQDPLNFADVSSFFAKSQ